MSNHKKDRTASLIVKTISEIIQFELKNTNLGFVTVTEGKLNRDNSLARIYVTFFNEKDSEEHLTVLNKNKGYIRSLLAQRVKMFKVPDIIFVLDETYQKARQLEATLKKEAEQLKKK
jgi:ribosome-binding factor A